MLTIELLTGQSPFSRENEENDQNVISRRIQEDEPNIPPTVNPFLHSCAFHQSNPLTFQIGKDARDFIEKLLKKKPQQRLGYKHDAEDIKKHRFFKSIDWNKLQLRKCPAPINLNFESPEDCSQFAKEFTDQDPVEKPAERLPKGPRHFRSKFFPREV